MTDTNLLQEKSQQPNGRPNGINAPATPAQQQMNGHVQHNMAPANPNVGSDKPWAQNPPLDTDLVNARNLLGAWEKSMHWSTPISPFTKAITTWLWQNLEQNADVGMDPREGSIEIEAKIGTLVDVDSGHRIQLPVLNACVISPAQNRKMRFESEMNEVSVPTILGMRPLLILSGHAIYHL